MKIRRNRPTLLLLLFVFFFGLRQCHGDRGRQAVSRGGGVAVVAGSGRGGAGSDRELQPVAEGWQGAEAAGSDRRVGKWKAVQEVFLGGTEGERQRQGVAASGVGGGDEKDHMFSRKEEMDCSASNEQFGRKNNTAGVVHCKKKGRKNEHMDSPHTKEQKHAH